MPSYTYRCPKCHDSRDVFVDPKDVDKFEGVWCTKCKRKMERQYTGQRTAVKFRCSMPTPGHANKEEKNVSAS